MQFLENETSFILCFSEFVLECLTWSRRLTDLKELRVIYLGLIQFNLETDEETDGFADSSPVSQQSFKIHFIYKTMRNIL